MPQPITIAFADTCDLIAVEELIADLIDTLHSEEGINRQGLANSLVRLYEAPNSYMLVARKDGKVVGFARFYTRQTALNPKPTAALDELVVSKEHRRQGIGKLLVEKVTDECKKLHCCEIEVSTEIDNTDAQEFYKNCGFSEEAILFEKHL